MAQTAVIKTGGKQYLVAPGQKLNIEKLSQVEGEDVLFEEVLLVEADGKARIGVPFVEGAKVRGKVVSHGKGEKLFIFKFKPKKREARKIGHRQPYTQVEILSIEA
ncbi:MAG: 50S ribosomal protein L21 [Candidatus Wildermuthbacteria bacterium RIFCSPHIGHO2_12_FULL_45_9]|uniref:Large ribosomal subunit protein bL21 n=1 Tax=Candidatus Wildermuthbacteria bacterium RIFCSPHIGHO2_02_FULL_45_25 TaxID=1802450 RepID=A0A1G2R358_9BACT|nr:MAG: 50S ribosomal protein L21 [Candidatus Wildermuthbacteria bacterium RIFCSPHIGHO2_01_FULL_45_20]OHA67223.1 MAG: 50S ribosomal protein L21 [Candidatus Wildermuthbacteria bacterium RIFCSPHIGHO2_02_FULL_45_25]OHA71896.1 MAG: 50S ribosomal protein L21 [Candidatus Wildermuthbacteria bacterium RIFCSPHIGHO2_12_FULL_45_9]